MDMSNTNTISGECGNFQESWKVAHIEAMECVNLEEIISSGLDWFNAWRREDEEWSRSVQSGAKAFDVNKAEELLRFYRKFLSPTNYLLERIAATERRGYNIGRVLEFKDAVKLATAISTLSAERIAKSVEQKKLGQTIPLETVLYGVQGGTDRPS
jgi:hypothetical protein